MAKKSDYPVFEPFNPLDKRHLGASVANALLESDIYPLPPEPFIGAGVYALYYVGDFPAYEVLAEVNRNGEYACPIYVGKAVPDGARNAKDTVVNRKWALQPFSVFMVYRLMIRSTRLFSLQHHDLLPVRDNLLKGKKRSLIFTMLMSSTLCYRKVQTNIGAKTLIQIGLEA